MSLSSSSSHPVWCWYTRDQPSGCRSSEWRLLEAVEYSGVSPFVEINPNSSNLITAQLSCSKAHIVRRRQRQPIRPDLPRWSAGGGGHRWTTRSTRSTRSPLFWPRLITAGLNADGSWQRHGETSAEDRWTHSHTGEDVQQKLQATDTKTVGWVLKWYEWMNFRPFMGIWVCKSTLFIIKYWTYTLYLF